MENTLPSEITKALKELKTLIEKYCGGKFELYYLDKTIPKICESSNLKHRHIAIDLPPPDYHHHEAFKTRKQKLKEIREMGINPYPHIYKPTTQTHTLQDKFKDVSIGDSEAAEKGKTDLVKVAGRLVLFRAMGKNAFAQIQDEMGFRMSITGAFQAHALSIAYRQERDGDESQRVQGAQRARNRDASFGDHT